MIPRVPFTTNKKQSRPLSKLECSNLLLITLLLTVLLLTVLMTLLLTVLLLTVLLAGDRADELVGEAEH